MGLRSQLSNVVGRFTRFIMHVVGVVGFKE